MHFLHALGINQYALVQFVFFVFIFAFLTTMVFGPYFRAFTERQRRTASGENVASEYMHRTAALNTEYQNKARTVRAEIQDIFHKSRTEATAEFDRIVNAARAEANALVEKNRAELTKAVAAAGGDLKGQTQSMALAITNKLLGK